MIILNKSAEACEKLSLLDEAFINHSEQSPEEREFLFTLVQTYKPKKIVEIGVSAGASAVVISSAMQTYMHESAESKPHLYSIDYSTQ